MKKAKLIVAPGETCADLRYVSGFAAPDSFLYFEDESGKTIVVSPLEFGRAKSQAAPGVHVCCSSEFASTHLSMRQLTVLIAKERGWDVIQVPDYFPLGLAESLRADGLNIAAVCGSFCPEREWKNHDEVREIRKALRVTEEAMRRGWEVLEQSTIASDRTLIFERAPLTAERLRAEIDVELIRRGANAHNTIVAPGRQSAEPHNEGSGIISADVPIVIDIFPSLCSSAYYGDLTRTVVKGHAAPIVRRAFEAVRDARDQAKKRLRAGVNPAEIHRFAAEELSGAGFPTGVRPDGSHYGFFHGLGHGVGLEIHEAPRLSPGNSVPFKGGEIVTVEPGVYDSGWGGVRLEDMVLIRPGDCECLTVIEDVLEIA